MDVKKTRAYRFTVQDASGRFHVVHLQAEHLLDRGADRLRLQVVHGGALPLEVVEFVDEDVANRVVKTDSMP